MVHFLRVCPRRRRSTTRIPCFSDSASSPPRANYHVFGRVQRSKSGAPPRSISAPAGCLCCWSFKLAPTCFETHAWKRCSSDGRARRLGSGRPCWVILVSMRRNVWPRRASAFCVCSGWRLGRSWGQHYKDGTQQVHGNANLSKRNLPSS